MREQQNFMQNNLVMDSLLDALALKVAQAMQNTKPPEKKLLNAREAEDYTDLSGSTLRLRVREGKLKKRKVGGRVYFARDDLDEMMERDVTYRQQHQLVQSSILPSLHNLTLHKNASWYKDFLPDYQD